MEAARSLQGAGGFHRPPSGWFFVCKDCILELMKKTIHPQNPAFYKDYYLGIGLTKEQVDISDVEKIARKKGFREQNHRHITILNEKTFLPLFNKFDKSKQKKILHEIDALIKKTDWNFTPKDIYYVAGRVSANTDGTVEESRESFIRSVEMPSINTFIIKLNKILQADIPFRFPHITLFTKGEGENPKFYGIPISSKEEFKKLKTKKIK